MRPTLAADSPHQHLWYLCLVILAANTRSVSASDLPYNPARVLYSPEQTGKYVYVLQPGADSTRSAEFASLDITESQDASSLSLNILSSDLPFFSTSSSTAYTTIIGSTGNITVLAGTCAAGSHAPSVWRFQPSAQAHHGNGSWAEDSVDSATSDPMTGANYLSAGIAFSQIAPATDSSTSLFYFAGMCPNNDVASASSTAWTTAADYSDAMLSLKPQAHLLDSVDYQLSVVAANGPPIAEAGFSITPLSPSYANSSDGTQTQQQDFVLLGGHTQAAFINMSQVAIFSLPKATWSFLPIDQPVQSASKKRSIPINKVSPRSGHTAVITDDGQKIVVYGGWVGNVSTPASPQLAIVSLGLGVGGEGDWNWIIPDQPSEAHAPAKGVYGHGAAMLPGNVMMVVGGHPTSNSPVRGKRDSGTQALFYNVTSNTWLTSYSSSSISGTQGHQASKSSGLGTTSQKAALAIGIVLAVILLAGLAVFGVWYKRRAKRQQETRNSLSQALVNEKDQQRFSAISASAPSEKYPELDPYNEDTTNSKGQFPWLPEISSTMGRQLDADCTGAYRNIPSPTRGLRKSSGARTFSYTPAPPPDDNRAIHMIEERDEEASLRSRSEAKEQRRIAAVRDIFGPNLPRPVTATSDPFKDPKPDPLRSHPVSPEIDQRSISSMSPSKFGHNSVTFHKDQITSWVNNWSSPHQDIQKLHSSNGRRSPSKFSERTGSNLSDSSAYSMLSSRSTTNRPASSRSSAPYPVSVPVSPVKDDRAFSFNRDKAPDDLAHSRSIRTSPVKAVARQVSPKRSFARLRSEGAALLHGDSKRPASSIYSDREAGTAETSQSLLSGNASHHRSQPSSPRKAGWMGSIKRVFGTVSDRSFSANEPMTQFGIERSYTTNPAKSAATTPSRRPPPRRTASESSAFLRTRQGKHDWENGTERETAWEPYDNTPDMGIWGGPAPPSPPPPVPHHRLLPARKPVAGPGYRRPITSRTVKPDKFIAKSTSLRNSGDDDNNDENDDDDDWDVEQAAANRDFQVMFTVPKARLRVVNADVDRLSQRSVSDENKKPSRGPSVRSQRSVTVETDRNPHAM